MSPLLLSLLLITTLTTHESRLTTDPGAQGEGSADGRGEATQGPNRHPQPYIHRVVSQGEPLIYS